MCKQPTRRSPVFRGLSALLLPALSALALTARAAGPAPAPALPLHQMHQAAPDTSGKNFLLVIDGVVKGRQQDLKAVDSLVKPEEIKAINVLKGAAALEKYGEQGREGVLEITTKHAPPTAAADAGGEAPDPLIFEKVEQQAQFPGGQKAWSSFLQNHLKAATPALQGAPAGIYTVAVRFVVHRDGALSGFETLTKPGFGAEEEALRVMKLSPSWRPAVQNGRRVSSFQTQSITFVVGSKKPVKKTARH
ncbi:hypothetical protein V9K67_11160 [Paraflavisolibacter sp. H34]|uniref:energy transducer TonB n=1 Tax=Huijunlia imazamoxiresistens TaxID=3127457 RepID=UPI003018E933